MAKLTLHGWDKLEKGLQRMSSQKTVDGIAKRAIYVGAEVMADALGAAVDNVPKSNNWAKGLGPKQADGLKAGVGVSTMKNNGGVISNAVGFSGYNEYGQPNVMLARAWEGGSSINPATHAFSSAIRQARGNAESAMAEQANEDFQNVADKAFE